MVDLMVDSPRFNRPLADADRWAERYDVQEAPERR